MMDQLDGDDVKTAAPSSMIPPVLDESIERGDVLPRVIQMSVARRLAVKHPDKREETSAARSLKRISPRHDIHQRLLK